MVTRQITYNPAASFEVKTFEVKYRQDGETAWLAEIYQPQGIGPFPVLLEVHGGAWSAGDRLFDVTMNESIAAAGMVVAAIDFRLGPEHQYPSSIADVNYATRWLKSKAKEFNGDPSLIGGMGSSSGGHMILLSAMRPFDPRYSALPLVEAPDLDARLDYVVACWPVIDPVVRYHYAVRTGRDELVERHHGYWINLENMADGNPQKLLDRGDPVEMPPVQIIQGTSDDNIPMEIPEAFVASYRAAGGPIEIEIFPDQPHSFAKQPTPEAERAIELIKKFIARQVPN